MALSQSSRWRRGRKVISFFFFPLFFRSMLYTHGTEMLYRWQIGRNWSESSLLNRDIIEANTRVIETICVALVSFPFIDASMHGKNSVVSIKSTNTVIAVNLDSTAISSKLSYRNSVRGVFVLFLFTLAFMHGKHSPVSIRLINSTVIGTNLFDPTAASSKLINLSYRNDIRCVSFFFIDVAIYRKKYHCSNKIDQCNNVIGVHLDSTATSLTRE